jgi:hypothetical protein
MTNSKYHNTAAENVKSVEGDAKENVALRIYTPMTMSGTNLGLEIYSPLPITINGVTIFSAAPIRIISAKYPKRDQVRIESAAGLNPAFIQGWNALPDELKTKVLSFNLINPETIDNGIMPYTSQFRGLLHHLRTTPVIAGLAREIYYTQNVFLLEPTAYTILERQRPLPVGRYCFLYPAASVNALIRSVEFLCGLDAAPWLFLTRFGRGSYGFGDVRYITVTLRASYLHICYPEDFDNFFENAVGEGLRFGCEGHVELIADEADVMSAENRRQMSRMEDLMKRKIWFGYSDDKRGVAPQ